MNSRTIITKSPNDTFQVGKEIGLKITKPTLIGMHGNLGTGKTVFAKGVAEGLEVKELINSPTFLGINENFSGRLPFIHMDFYMKVHKNETVKSYFENGSVILIEWVENFNKSFVTPLDTNINVYIDYVKDKNGNIVENERQLKIDSLSAIL